MNHYSVDTIINSRSFAYKTYFDMTELCSPMLKKFGFIAFEYARVYDDGTAITLYSDHKIPNYVINKQLHISAHVPQEIVSKEFWFMPDPNGPWSSHMSELKKLANAGSFSNYIIRSVGYYEMFCYIDQAEQHIGYNKFINKKESLEYFASEFVEQAKKLISYVDRDRFTLLESMRSNFHGLQSEEAITRNNLQIYLTKIQRELMQLDANNVSYFSPQQLKCIAYLMQGRTASDMAELMDISFRTVEMHLRIIREKLGCNKKSDIIGAIIKLHEQ